MSDLSLRENRLEVSEQKSIPPFSLDPTLTFYCPQENLDAFEHPAIRGFHDFLRSEYVPPAMERDAVLLLMPCTKTKPYAMSKEHREINSYLQNKGFRPTAVFDVPEGLAQHLPKGYPPDVLNANPLARDGLVLHRMVVSEPMGLVPYEHMYFWRGEPSPASRYDDPGLFEHRGTSVCPWRDDCTAQPLNSGKYRWGSAERAAYVEAHNYLSQLITDVLQRVKGKYRKIVGYVSPKLTHRSFLSSNSEKKENGIPLWKMTDGGRQALIGVNERVPGLVDIVPSANELKEIKEALAGRLAGEGKGSRGQVQAYFASGGGGATSLILPEALRKLEEHIVAFG